MKLLFVTDLHGGNAVFRKSLRLMKLVNADILLIGGDIAGKYLVPIVAEGEKRIVKESGKTRSLGREDEVSSYIRNVAEVGGHAVVCSPEEADRLRFDDGYREEILRRERTLRLRTWLAEAKEQLAPASFLLNMGNDDPFYLDEEVERSGGMEILEDQEIQLAAGFSIVSCGYTNPTPWNCPRDCTEEELWFRLEKKLTQCAEPRRVIANFHCPPCFSHLDRAPRLDGDLRPLVGVNGVEYVHVGSAAVRRALEEFAPAVALHGHIHEAYAKERIGDTICASPGSAYHEGTLRAVVVHLACGRVEGVQLVREA